MPWTCSTTCGNRTATSPGRWRRGCGRARSTSSSARSTSSGRASCSAGCSSPIGSSSLIFYGPPGRGKTALAHVIANHTKSRFKPLNAVAAGIKEVRELLAEARQHLEELGERTILFLDEIHRFNRAQQDVLLPDVEDGVVILIGATTQNPFFAINSPLLCRSQIFTLRAADRASTSGRSSRGRSPTRNAASATSR